MISNSKPRCWRAYTAALLISASIVSPAVADEPVSDSFDFRGARLGMTLEEFQSLPPLGISRLIEYSERGKKIRENLTSKCAIAKDKANAQIGVVDCARAGDDPFTIKRYKYIYTSVGYSFGPDANGIKRLFSILVITDRDNYDEAVLGLRSKWGAGKPVTSTVTNGLGQPLPKVTETWQKPDRKSVV